MQNTKNTQELRLDKWLWAARFFKTRALATDAINGGKVHLNKMRVKPAKKVKPGDRLIITKGEMVFDITVKGINSQRRPAKEAVLLYEESAESIAKRNQKAQQMREKRLNNREFSQADKKQKRQVRQFKSRI